MNITTLVDSFDKLQSAFTDRDSLDSMKRMPVKLGQLQLQPVEFEMAYHCQLGESIDTV